MYVCIIETVSQTPNSQKRRRLPRLELQTSRCITVIGNGFGRERSSRSRKSHQLHRNAFANARVRYPSNLETLATRKKAKPVLHGLTVTSHCLQQ